jgi:hypothetical protein
MRITTPSTCCGRILVTKHMQCTGAAAHAECSYLHLPAASACTALELCCLWSDQRPEWSHLLCRVGLQVTLASRGC